MTTTCAKGNIYQIDTVIQLNGSFYNVLTNSLADPNSVILYIEDPSGNITQIIPPTVIRTGVGLYNYPFLPGAPGQWTYKWRGLGSPGVVATSRDTCFFVKASPLIQ